VASNAAVTNYQVGHSSLRQPNDQAQAQPPDGDSRRSK
jgi:hypothetical protein